jgi:hypothetical protein
MLSQCLSRVSVGIFVIALVMGATLFAPAGRSCGYHDPSQVAAGILNLIYPKALYVQTAAWQAKQAGVLPKRETGSRDLFAYQRMAARLQDLSEKLGQAAPDAAKPRFAAVLLDSLLWARFVPVETGYQIQVHAKGPEPGDVVIVTHGDVIRELADGSLDAARAEKLGLMRYYGPGPEQQAVRSLFADAITQSASNM